IGKTRRITAAESVREALRNGCRTISWTYNEPTIWFEYTLEGAKLARAAGLDTVYVTNGFITPEGLDMIGPYLGAFRVDLKGFSRAAYKKISGISKFEGILEVAARAKHRWGMHVECVTNVTPTINDDEKELRALAAWIKKNLGPDTPWHVTRFYPYLDLAHLPPTPVPALVRAREIGLEEGLRYVYLGNVPGHVYDNTYCHGCGTLLIEREGFFVVKNRIIGGKCPHCGTEIPGRF
ncbi:MAG: radical SAM protein, partial [Nitrospirae bacterium]|nr:radical SAM protein [Nitrospirota bacterium]